MIKLAIGMPTAGTVKLKTMYSVIKLVRKIPANFIAWEGCLVHQNRENIVKEALKSDYTHLLFVDSDMVFEPEAVEQLLQRDKDIIGVATNVRKLPPVSTVKIHDEKGEDVSKILPDGLLECFAVGTGFMLIKTSVFQKISHPWFGFEQDKEGNTTTGEDMWFCKKAREEGYKIYCDLNVKVGHIGEYIY